MASGRLLQTWAAATGKARLPTVDSLMGGMTRRLVVADHTTRRPGRSARATRGPGYRGALSCRTLNVICHSLWTVLHLMYLRVCTVCVCVCACACACVYVFVWVCAWCRCFCFAVAHFAFHWDTSMIVKSQFVFPVSHWCAVCEAVLSMWQIWCAESVAAITEWTGCGVFWSESSLVWHQAASHIRPLDVCWYSTYSFWPASVCLSGLLQPRPYIY